MFIAAPPASDIPIPDSPLNFNTGADKSTVLDPGGNISMDIDPGTLFPSAQAFLQLTFILIDFPAAPSAPTSEASTSASSVCLPYSLVPGMDFTSSGFQKALITLGKQKRPSAELRPMFTAPQPGNFPLVLSLQNSL